MLMAREYFCCYHSYLEVMEQLNDAERGRLFTACLEYSKTGEAPELFPHILYDLSVRTLRNVAITQSVQKIVHLAGVVFEIVEVIVVKGVESVFPSAVPYRALNAVDLVAVGVIICLTAASALFVNGYIQKTLELIDGGSYNEALEYYYKNEKEKAEVNKYLGARE